jgi:tetratricopeptide (TPR) repeat protein
MPWEGRGITAEARKWNAAAEEASAAGNQLAAAKAWAAAIRADGKNAEAIWRLGLWLEESGRESQAAVLLDRLAEEWPENAEVQAARGRATARTEGAGAARTATALEGVRAAMASGGDSAMLAEAESELLLARGEWEEALAAAERGRELAGDDTAEFAACEEQAARCRAADALFDPVE